MNSFVPFPMIYKANVQKWRCPINRPQRELFCAALKLCFVHLNPPLYNQSKIANPKSLIKIACERTPQGKWNGLVFFVMRRPDNDLFEF